DPRPLRRAARAAAGDDRQRPGEGGDPRAEGGRREPEGAARRAHRRRPRPRAVGGARGAAARRRVAPDRCLTPLTSDTMRLYDTYTRSLVDLPAPPGPVRMYVCGPTVYARAHVGNARPFVLGMWLRSWLRATGYEATLVHNITDINDKI